ncbi:MAG: NADH-quinone oxidoreductase subunit A [Planctomycetes bacterium]|nr:NADH-quinone oxidoreductase subunit A [Planctomycetota bacterium]
MQLAIIPLLLFVAAALALSVTVVFVGRLFGPRRSTAVKAMPYESGMDPKHDTRRRFDVRFHLVAIAFLLFDVELLFLYPWAVAAKPVDQKAVGWTVYPTLTVVSEMPVRGIDAAVAAGDIADRHMVFWGVVAFFMLLLAGFIYDWRKGVFRWR